MEKASPSRSSNAGRRIPKVHAYNLKCLVYTLNNTEVKRTSKRHYVNMDVASAGICYKLPARTALKRNTFNSRVRGNAACFSTFT